MSWLLCGTVAVALVLDLQRRSVTVANLGDCRVVLGTCAAGLPVMATCAYYAHDHVHMRTCAQRGRGRGRTRGVLAPVGRGAAHGLS